MGQPATYITVSTLILTIIALISVGLRFWVRIKQGAGLAQDDWMLLAGSAFAVALCITTILEVYLGHIGQHVEKNAQGVPQYGDSLHQFWKIEWIGTLLLIVGYTLIKGSLVLLYRRIFRGARFRIFSTLLLVIIYSWGFAFFLAVLLQCKPVLQVTLPPQDRTGQCFSPTPVFEGHAVANLIIDIAILVTPQPIVWKLHMSLKQRAAVSVIFLLGTLVVAIGAIRVYYFIYVNIDLQEKLADIAWYHAPAFYWTNFDACVAIICASLPTLNPILASLSPGVFLRSIASKIHLRSSPKQSWNNLPEWESRWGTDGTSSAHGLNQAAPPANAYQLKRLDTPDDQPKSVASSAV